MVDNGKTIRLLAERQMGAFLKAMPKNRGSAGQLVGPGKIGAASSEAPTKLSELGITHHESANAQKLADIPEPEFKERITPTLAPIYWPWTQTSRPSAPAWRGQSRRGRRKCGSPATLDRPPARRPAAPGC